MSGRTVLSREAWILAGQQLLRETGVPGVKLTALTRRLGVTSGSFYHHFRDFDEYVGALADYYGTENVERVIEILEQDGEPVGWLHHLDALAQDMDVAQLDVAMRVWATTSDRARTSVARLDQAFLDVAERAYRALGFDDEDARLRARITYSAGIGRHLIFSDAQLRPEDAAKALDLLTRDAPVKPRASR